MTKSGFDIDELERLLGDIGDTIDEWIGDTIDEWDDDEPRDDWYGWQRNILKLHNSAHTMIAAIRELRAENARLREAMDEDGLTEIITDTLDMDWQPRWAAQAIRRAALGEPQ